MTAQELPYPGLRQLIDTFTNWLQYRREMNEMDCGDFERIAKTCGFLPAISTRWSATDRTPPTSCRRC
jgi:hypothetical protein